jgi:quercetin dioxygenase-like cupin family protein
MSTTPYIVYPDTANFSASPEGGMIGKYVSELDQVSFGVIDFSPGMSRILHHHNTWELIIVDDSSDGPGFAFFDGHWWRVEPGSAVFVPKGYPHAWSSG